MTPDAFRNALILTGPTGSGKSRLALDLAERLDAEILAMDSMTLYRGMDVGTAKPTADDRARVPHHLLDVLDPSQSASVALWLQLAARAVRDIEARGRQALLVGGTALYLKAVLCGLFDGPPADAALRRCSKRRRSNSASAGTARPASARRRSGGRGALHPNDAPRRTRLEVHSLTGRPISAWQTQWAERPPAVEAVCLDLPREQLYQRIDARVLQMMRDGLLDEVRRLRTLDPPLSREARQALGYKELLDHLDGRRPLDEAVREVQTRSRNFAKRQLTWFRGLPGVRMASSELTMERWRSRMR
ncbi:MAG: tRNA (adenosine(37)-N6)-dimethylallyltransferase MiaA [Gemmataceae bacterium]